MALRRHKTIPREIMGNQRSCRCKFKTKFILEVPNMFKAIWLWMWEVDRVIFCPVAWSIPFSSGIGLPLFNISRFDWKSSFRLSRTPPSLRQRYCLPPLSAFSLLCGFVSAIPNRFYTYVKYIPYSMDRGIAKKSLTRPLLSTPPPHIPLRKTLCRSKLGT